MVKRILVLCTGNSCRSQMAEGYLRQFNADTEVMSGGIARHGVNPLAIQVMSEDGVDISAHTSNLIDEYANLHFDVVITVCDHANEVCPIFPSESIRLHHNFTDPSKLAGSDEEVLPAYRTTRDAIKEYILQLTESNFII